MSDVEPHGHRGHPTDGETRHSAYVAQRLGALVAVLIEAGFEHEEAVAFIAGAAYDTAAGDGETWSTHYHALRTTSDLLAGRSAKWWSLGAISRAIDMIATELT